MPVRQVDHDHRQPVSPTTAGYLSVGLRRGTLCELRLVRSRHRLPRQDRRRQLPDRFVGSIQPGVTLVSAGTRAEPGPVTIVNNQNRFCNYYSRGKIIKNTSPFYTLPDIGYVEDGQLYLLGRDDEVFNAAGNKVAFSIIDAALRDTPGILDVGIAGGGPIGDPMGIVIGVVAAEGFDMRQAMAVVARSTSMAAPGDLVRIFQCGAIARNATGKVDRGALLSAYRSAKGAAAT